MREVIVADRVKDLPADIRKKVLNMGVDESTLDMHFDILCTVMHFKLKHVFKTASEANKLNEKREFRNNRRKELLAAAAQVKSTGRRPTRARAMTASKDTPVIAEVPIQAKLMQWLDDLEVDAAELDKEAAESDEEDVATNSAKKTAEKPKTKRDEIVEEGQKLSGVGEPQQMARKYKVWRRSAACHSNKKYCKGMGSKRQGRIRNSVQLFLFLFGLCFSFFKIVV